jgi:hypothetical protein
MNVCHLDAELISHTRNMVLLGCTQSQIVLFGNSSHHAHVTGI